MGGGHIVPEPGIIVTILLIINITTGQYATAHLVGSVRRHSPT